MADDTWYSRAVPILEAVAAAERGTGGEVTIGELSDETELGHDEVETELERLIDAGYIAGEIHRTMAAGRKDHWRLRNPVVAERGARAIGLWPTADPYERLIELLEARIADEPDPERKSRLRTLRDSLADVGKGTAAAVLAELIKAGAVGAL